MICTMPFGAVVGVWSHALIVSRSLLEGNVISCRAKAGLLCQFRCRPRDFGAGRTIAEMQMMQILYRGSQASTSCRRACRFRTWVLNSGSGPATSIPGATS